MPSGLPSTGMVLMSFSVRVSHIATGLLEEKPWRYLASAAAPRALVSGSSPAGVSESSANTDTRAPAPERGTYRRRPEASA